MNDSDIQPPIGNEPAPANDPTVQPAPAAAPKASTSLDRELAEVTDVKFVDKIDDSEFDELMNVLEKHGVKRIDPLGQKFDPNRHQAMYEIEDASVPAGSVVQVMQAGYLIGDRMLRPALVAVAKGGAKAAPATSANDNPTQ